MSWVAALKNFTNDTVRQVQFFMLCRQLGIIFSSIVVAWSLPIQEVGIFEMLMFVGYLMTFFWSDALLRGFLANKELQSRFSAITSFFLLYFIGSVVVMGLLLAAQKLLIPILTSRPDLEGLEVFAVYQVLIVPLWIAPLIGLLKGQNIALAALYVLIGPAFSCWTGYNSLPGMQGILLGLFCYALVGFIWALIQTKFIRGYSLPGLLRLIWPAAWPLMLYAISNGLARSFDVWLVARHFSEEIFAVFRYGAREFPLVVALSAGLSTAIIPRLHHEGSLEELKRRSVRIMHSCYPIIAFLLVLSPVLFEMIFGLQYKPGAAIFNIYLLVTLTQLVFPQSIITARGDTKILWYVSVAELLVNIVASIILMQLIGLEGIAWGTCIAFAFEKLVLITFIHRRYGIKLSQIIQVRTWLLYAILLFGMYLLSTWVFGI